MPKKSSTAAASTQGSARQEAIQRIGVPFSMPREGKEAVEMNLYLLADGSVHPLVINLHGGAFIAGDADMLDAQSDRISRAWGVNVATVDYKLLSSKYSIAYATREVTDTILYFKAHASEYQIDPDKIFVLGYSAGAYHAIASTLALKQSGIDVAGQIVCYGYIRDANETYLSLDEAARASIAPALFILADNDPISEGSLAYQRSLAANGVSTQIQKYEGAVHTFMEGSLDYQGLRAFIQVSEQQVLARQAENRIGDWVHDILAP